jgi:translation initiation factor IF-3
MFRGREIVHKDIARELMDKILEDMEDKCVVEQPPKMEGYNMTMLLGPS